MAQCEHLPRCTMSALDVYRWRLAARAGIVVRARHCARDLDQQALVQVTGPALDALANLSGKSRICPGWLQVCSTV